MLLMFQGSVFSRFTGPPVFSILICGFVISLVGCDARRPVGQAEPGRVVLAGSNEVLWLIREDAAPDGSTALQLYFRTADPSTFGRFIDLPIPPIAGRPVEAAARGPFLHVFYQGGTHRRYAPVEPSLSRLPPQVQFIELSFPDGQTPAAVAADAELDRLYALVPQSVSAALPPESDEQPDPAELGTAPGEAEAERPPPSSPWAIVRYENARWAPDREAPPDIDVHIDHPLMLVSNEFVHLVYRSNDRRQPWLHRYTNSASSEWRNGTLPDLAEWSPVSGGWDHGDAVVLWSRAAPNGLTARSVRFVSGAWEDDDTVVDNTTLTADRGAITLFDGGIAVAAPAEAGTVNVKLWSKKDGQLSGPESQIVAPPARTTPGADSFFQYAVLCGILGVLFIWRRDTLTRPAPLHEGLVLAQLSKRAVALLIDLAILFPVWGPIVFELWRRDAPNLTVAQQLALSPRAAAPSLLWSKAVVGAVVGLYAAILEAWTGMTAGKRLVGLAVTGAHGGRCGFVAIIVRNLARIIEFHFPPLILLVAFTPSRQRLGDLLAKSVVVEPVANLPPIEADAEGADEDAPGD